MKSQFKGKNHTFNIISNNLRECKKFNLNFTFYYHIKKLNMSGLLKSNFAIISFRQKKFCLQLKLLRKVLPDKVRFHMGDLVRSFLMELKSKLCTLKSSVIKPLRLRLLHKMCLM